MPADNDTLLANFEAVGPTWTACPDMPVVTDIDGNVYHTLHIGNQCWLQENLKTTRYRDGSAIDYPGTDTTEWQNNTTGAYAWYNNDETTYKNTYGALYNWYTVNTGKLCPTGWHVPTYAEWTIFTSYLEDNGYGYEGSGNDIAKSLASTTGWNASSTPGTPGNDQAGNNRSGFSGIPSGGRRGDGKFVYIGETCQWWTAKDNPGTYWTRYIKNDNDMLMGNGSVDKAIATPVRCVYGDEPSLPSLTTTPISSISQITAVSGGDIVNDGGAAITSRGVCWSTTIHPTVADSITADMSGTGSFISYIAGLKANSTYYVRAYAINSAGTGYGEELTFQTADSTVPDACLIAWYPFNGNANDESGVGVDGIVNGATLTSDRFGHSNAAYYFNGTNSSITIPGYLSITDSFTISFWAYLENESGYSNILTDGGINYSGNDFLINFRNNDIGIRADKGGNPLNFEYNSPAELTNLNLVNRWVHVVWTMNPVGSTIYLNGSKIATIDVKGTNEGYHDDHVTIGSRHVWTNMDNYFKGKLDDIRIYSCPLNAEEVYTVYGGVSYTQPVVETNTITTITDTSATIEGNITSSGRLPVIARGICWNTSPNPTTADNKTIDGTETGMFSSSISGLTGCTVYYVRAYATNSIGTSYGNQVSFTTASSGKEGTIPSIPDITWSQVTAGPGTDFTGSVYVAFGNNTFVTGTDNGCVSTNNSAYISNDFGLSWIQKATPGSTDISGVAFSPVNNYFVISHRCYEFSRNYSYSSDNGNIWTPMLHVPDLYADYRYDLFRVKDYFFSSIYGHTCDRSPDGVNWTNLTFAGSNTASVTTYSEKFGLYYANDGYNFWTSPDATTWTKRDTLGKFRYIAGNDVVLAYKNNTNSPSLLQSVDGLTFQPICSPPNVSYIYRIKFLNGLYWAVISVNGDDSKKVMVSYDGTIWEILNTPSSGQAYDIDIGYDSILKKNIIILPCNEGLFLRGVYDSKDVLPSLTTS